MVASSADVVFKGNSVTNDGVSDLDIFSLILDKLYIVLILLIVAYPLNLILDKSFFGIGNRVETATYTKGFAIPTAQAGGLRSPLDPTIM